MFKEFKLPKTGETATIEILAPTDLSEVLELQKATRDALPEEQKMFVLPQTPAYFQSLLARENGLMIGIRTNGKLISQMVIMGTMMLQDAVDQQKLTRNEVAFHHAEPTDSITMAKSMAVHPDWRGNELSQNMLEASLTLPFVRAADHMFAQISVDNIRSWELFLKHGFGIVAAAVDPGDNKARFIVQRPTLGFSLHHTASSTGVDATANFAAIMRLTQREALIGQLGKPEIFRLAFYASAEMAATWFDTPAGAKF